MKSPRALAIAGVILVGAGAGMLLQRTATPGDAGSAGERGSAPRFLQNPRPVPAFTVQDLDGRAISSADFRDKVTLVNFWATWCPPCLAELPWLVALQEKYRDHLQIIGISEDDESADVVRRFVTKLRVNYPVAMTTPDVERAFPGVDALPTSFLIDREGRIVQIHVGILSPVITEHEIQSLAGLPLTTPAGTPTGDDRTAVKRR